MRFAGRERELALLAKRLAEVRKSGNGTLIAMRGRRRVGKSRLVEEFVQGSGCPSVFYTAVQEESETELRRFTRAIEASDAPRAAEARAGLRPETWEAALALAAEGATRAKPLILVIDDSHTWWRRNRASRPSCRWSGTAHSRALPCSSS